MLIIRLSRKGKNREPYFRLIISEKTKDTVGDFLESLGFYDPKKKVLKMNEERIKYWLSKGAQASGTVKNLLISKGVMTGKKAKKGGRRKAEEKKNEAASDKKENPPPPAPQKQAPKEKTVEEKGGKRENPAAEEESKK
ncbi:MAG: 30S ribosomal protein S16 [Patescibacteria group bacterium]